MTASSSLFLNIVGLLFDRVVLFSAPDICIPVARFSHIFELSFSHHMFDLHVVAHVLKKNGSLVLPVNVLKGDRGPAPVLNEGKEVEGVQPVGQDVVQANGP